MNLKMILAQREEIITKRNAALDALNSIDNDNIEPMLVGALSDTVYKYYQGSLDVLRVQQETLIAYMQETE